MFNSLTQNQAPRRDFGSGGGGGGKIRGLDDILEVGKMSLDVLDSDIKASSPENIHYRHSDFIEAHIFPEVP